MIVAIGIERRQLLYIILFKIMHVIEATIPRHMIAACIKWSNLISVVVITIFLIHR